MLLLMKPALVGTLVLWFQSERINLSSLKPNVYIVKKNSYQLDLRCTCNNLLLWLRAKPLPQAVKLYPKASLQIKLVPRLQQVVLRHWSSCPGWCSWMTKTTKFVKYCGLCMIKKDTENGLKTLFSSGGGDPTRIFQTQLCVSSQGQ